jgi:hypothetical protein
MLFDSARETAKPAALRAELVACTGGVARSTATGPCSAVRLLARLGADLATYVVPNALRRSFASLLPAEGRTIHDVPGQLGRGAE